MTHRRASRAAKGGAKGRRKPPGARGRTAEEQAVVAHNVALYAAQVASGGQIGWQRRAGED